MTRQRRHPNKRRTRERVKPYPGLPLETTHAQRRVDALLAEKAERDARAAAHEAKMAEQAAAKAERIRQCPPTHVEHKWKTFKAGAEPGTVVQYCKSKNCGTFRVIPKEMADA